MVVPHAVLPLLAIGAKSYQTGVYGSSTGGHSTP
jgi:hypothetical protein